MSDKKTQDEVLRLTMSAHPCPQCGQPSTYEGECIPCKELPAPETTPKTEAFWKDSEPGLYGGRQKRLDIPTYDSEGLGDKEYDWARAREVTIADEVGLRIIMGDPMNISSPNVCLERAVDRWRLFIHIDGGDPFCYIEITDTQAMVLVDPPTREPLLVKERIV